jgi:hypothetical protein
LTAINSWNIYIKELAFKAGPTIFNFLKMIKIDGPKIEYNLIIFYFFMDFKAGPTISKILSGPTISKIITGPTIFKNLKIRNIHGPTKYNTHTQIFWETF